MKRHLSQMFRITFLRLGSYTNMSIEELIFARRGTIRNILGITMA